MKVVEQIKWNEKLFCLVVGDQKTINIQVFIHIYVLIINCLLWDGAMIQNLKMFVKVF